MFNLAESCIKIYFFLFQACNKLHVNNAEIKTSYIFSWFLYGKNKNICVVWCGVEFYILVRKISVWECVLVVSVLHLKKIFVYFPCALWRPLMGKCAQVSLFHYLAPTKFLWYFAVFIVLLFIILCILLQYVSVNLPGKGYKIQALLHMQQFMA